MASYSGIIGKRTLRPILWNLVLQACLLSCFVFVSRVNIFHPLNWFYDWYLNFIWYGSWIYMIPLTAMVVLLASASTEDYVKIQPFYATRFSLLHQAFNLHNFVVGILHLSIGFLIPWTYASITGSNYERCIYECVGVRNENCFSEKRFFLIMGGMWTSVLYFIHSHFFGTRYLKFPIVQLPKFILVKGKFLDTFRDSTKWIFIPNLSFIILYIFQGGAIASKVSTALGCLIEGDRLDSLTGIVNLELLAYLITFSLVINVTMRFTEVFSRVYLTERFYFPFYTASDDESPSLSKGLGMSDYPIIQHLAFLDLMLLSSHSKSRREEIFKLSSFGRHPHIWNAVKEGCSDMIVDFIEALEESMSLSPVSNPSGTNVKASLRRNVTDYFAGQNKTPYSNVTSPRRQVDSKGINSLIVDQLSKLRIYLYLFGNRKDMKIRHTLRLGLTVKWACESLSFLASHSIKEDKYGILVNDIPSILGLLLQLKITLENLLKRTSLAASLSRQDLENIAEATALKKSVKRSIYRIVNTFKSYISDLQLSKDVESQLMPFIMYRE